MSTGGQRFGAGRPLKGTAKVERLKRIDVRDWQRAGLLESGVVFVYQWPKSEHQSVAIEVKPSNTSVDLIYEVLCAGQTRRGDQTIQLSRTACNYGASRPWFECPFCSQRVAILYLRFERFACRHCQRAAYVTQSQDDVARTWRGQRKVEGRLGKEPTSGHLLRPKGMHRSTFIKLLGKVSHYQNKRAPLLEYLFLRLQASIYRIEGAAQGNR